MSVAILLRKKDFIESKNVCVETKWWRVPMIDSPESNLCRRYMLERVDHDPLSQKLITIYKSKGRTVAKNRDGNPVSISTYTHKHSTSKEELEDIHDMVVSAVQNGDIALEGNEATSALRTIIESYRRD